MKILMLIAHPDDEVVFGVSDLLSNNTTVICFTNRNNPIRKKEFEECMRLTNTKGYIFSLRDSMRDSWSELSDEILSQMVLECFTEKTFDFDMIVSHGADGEYGHIQHKRVHTIAKLVAQTMSCPFATFRERFRIDTTKKRDELIRVYQSQARILSRLKDYFLKNIE
jgi:LmbE family N-acetylglucosaminyl deacetylase